MTKVAVDHVLRPTDSLYLAVIITSMRIMKPLLLLSAALLIAGATFAQAQPAKGVVVTGIAEGLYEPDYIIITISNSEVQKAGRNNRNERELVDVLLQQKVDTALLTVERFNLGGYSSFLFQSGKYSVGKIYHLRIDDLSRYEEIVDAIADAGFRNIRLTSLGLAKREEREQQVLLAAIAAGKAKAAAINAVLDGRRLRLTGIEELPNNFRAEESSQWSGILGRGGIGVAGGLNDSQPSLRNMALGKVLLRKGVLMSYGME